MYITFTTYLKWVNIVDETHSSTLSQYAIHFLCLPLHVALSSHKSLSQCTFLSFSIWSHRFPWKSIPPPRWPTRSRRSDFFSWMVVTRGGVESTPEVGGVVTGSWKSGPFVSRANRHWQAARFPSLEPSWFCFLAKEEQRTSQTQIYIYFIFFRYPSIPSYLPAFGYLFFFQKQLFWIKINGGSLSKRKKNLILAFFL